MAVYSLMTFNGSAKPEGARAQDLVKLSTKAYLAERSVAKKSIAWAWVFTDSSPTARGATCWLSQQPLAVGDPNALLKAERSLDRHLQGRPLNLLAFGRRWAQSLKGQGQKPRPFLGPTQRASACAYPTEGGSRRRFSATWCQLWHL